MRAMRWMTAAAFCAAATAGQVRADLVSHWPFDSDLSDSVADNDGTFAGAVDETPEFIEGYDGTPGGAILFDGVDDRVDLAQNTFLPVSSQPVFSISVWVKGVITDSIRDRRFFSEGTTANNPLYNLGTNNNTTNASFDFFVRGDAGGATGTNGHRKSLRPLIDDTWHHLALIDDNGTVSVYIDGAPDTTNYNYARVLLTSTRTTVGAILRTAACCWFQGAVDELQIFDHALTHAEVVDLAGIECDETSGATCDGLEVVGPPEGAVGEYVATAGATDSAGGLLVYSFAATDGTAVMTRGPQFSNVASFGLGVGDWTISATVTGVCPDASVPNTCTSAPIIIDPPPALVSHWPFDGDLVDIAGDNDGVYTGDRGAPVFVPGFDGSESGAMSFNGTEIIVPQIVGGLPIFLHPSYTVALWVRGAPQSDRRVYSEGSNSGDNNPLVNVGTHNTGADGTVDLFYRRNAGQGTPIGHGHSGLTAFDDTWHHIVVTDEAGSITVYVDGVRDPASFEYIRGAFDVNVTSIGGVMRQTTCCLYIGDIDDVRVYNYVLSAEDIAGLIPQDGCPGAGDTSCDSLDVDGPPGNETGTWTASATATDKTGDDVLYTFTATTDEGDYIQRGPSASATADLDLAPGVWTIRVTTDDSLPCQDSPGSCETVVEVFAEPQVLLSHYRFDGDVLDSAGLNDGTLLGKLEGDPVHVIGYDCVPDGAVTFDGTNDAVELTDNTGDLPISTKAAYSVAMWVRGDPQVDRRVYSEESSTQNTTLFNIGTDNTGATGVVDIYIRDDNGSVANGNHQWSTGIAFDGAWHHIVWTDANGAATLYIDGVPDATDFTYMRSTTFSPDVSHIGAVVRPAAANPVCCAFLGDIDDVRLYNYILSPEEVTALVGDGPGDCCDGPDTSCDGLAVDGPEDRTAGLYTVTASASDANGSAISYSFRVDDGAGTEFTAGPQVSNTADFDLPPGTWFITVVVDDDPVCNEIGPNAECVRELAVAECPAAGDTHCTGLQLLPAPDSNSVFAAQASATDDSGDEVIYTFTASNGIDEIVVGPQAGSSADFDLAPGDWTVTVDVDDDPDCDDAAFDQSCSQEITIRPAGVDLVPGDGDANGDVNLTDVIHLALSLFNDPSGEAVARMPCLGDFENAGNRVVLDFNGDGNVDLADVVSNAVWQFSGGMPHALNLAGEGPGCTLIVDCELREGATTCTP